MLRHMFDLMESQLHYGTEKPWEKFAQDCNISLKLLIKLTLKNYARIHGVEGESSLITMASALDFETEHVKTLLAPLINSYSVQDKLAE